MSQGQEGSAAFRVGTFELNTTPVAVGAAMIAAGAVIGLAGMVISGSAILAAAKRSVDRMEVPPGELARQKLAKARAATMAGASAWQNGLGAGARTS